MRLRKLDTDIYPEDRTKESDETATIWEKKDGYLETFVLTIEKKLYRPKPRWNFERKYFERHNDSILNTLLKYVDKKFKRVAFEFYIKGLNIAEKTPQGLYLEGEHKGSDVYMTFETQPSTFIMLL